MSGADAVRLDVTIAVQTVQVCSHKRALGRQPNLYSPVPGQSGGAVSTADVQLFSLLQVTEL